MQLHTQEPGSMHIYVYMNISIFHCTILYVYIHIYIYIHQTDSQYFIALREIRKCWMHFFVLNWPSVDLLSVYPSTLLRFICASEILDGGTQKREVLSNLDRFSLSHCKWTGWVVGFPDCSPAAARATSPPTSPVKEARHKTQGRETAGLSCCWTLPKPIPYDASYHDSIEVEES